MNATAKAFRTIHGSAALQRNAEQVQEVVRICAKYEISFVPSGTGMDSVGSSVCRGEIVISFALKIELLRSTYRLLWAHSFMEIAESSLCCGYAGSITCFNLWQAGAGRSKGHSSVGGPASAVVSANAGWLLQLISGLRRLGEKPLTIVRIVSRSMLRCVEFPWTNCFLERKDI